MAKHICVEEKVEHLMQFVSVDAFGKKAEYIRNGLDFNYMMDNFETELVVMGAKIALTNYKLPFDPSKLKSFDRFHKKFGKYVITAMESK